MNTQEDPSRKFYHRGADLQREWRLEEAIASYSEAIHLDPLFAEAYCDRGTALYRLRRFEQAQKDYERAVALAPEHSNIRLNKAMFELLLGNYTVGWKEYEYRDASKAPLSANLPAERRWRSDRALLSEMAGQSILIYGEGGFGDFFQFCRYVPLLAQQGLRVVLSAHPAVERLMRQSFSGLQIEVVPENEIPAELDWHCSVMSLPSLFQTSIESIPATLPYLFAAPEKVNVWRTKLGTGGLRVGVVWSGGAHQDPIQRVVVNAHRNLPPALLAQLAVPGVEWFSLQKGQAAQAAWTHLLAEGWRGQRIVDLTDDLLDFSDTAALIECLDLVISVDTAVLHLAGAMGKPVWMLDRFDHCWRWLLKQNNSPWYPNLRIFRQPVRGDWDSVLGLVRESLSIWVREKGGAKASPPTVPFNAGEQLKLAVYQLQSGRSQEALQLLKEVLLERPKDPWVLYLLGTAQHELSAHAEALLFLDQALALAPDIAEAWFNRGLVLCDLQQPKQALESFDRALEIRPEYAKAQAYRQRVAFEMAQTRK